jgi:hypothetical protein
MKTLQIYEIDYSCSPGGINQFEVYDENEWLFCSTSLSDACWFAYSKGFNFTVNTLKQYNLATSSVNNFD